MEEVIEERKRSPLDDPSHNDLFSNLIRASEAEDDGRSLSPEELMGIVLLPSVLTDINNINESAGDTFIFLLAGHEVCS